LLRYPLGRPDIENQWLFERCREVQERPNGYLDLWAREHYKSTIITYGKTIQDILASHGDEPLDEWMGREVTVAIFSHTRPIAKGFLRQIMREFETNKYLVDLFPDILWKEPKRSAPKWSEDDGIVVKRKSNPKESTVEAWGIVDGQPTSKHFMIRNYDDVVTKESVRSPEMMAKTLESWELSLNLGTRGGIERYIGTRYHFNDTYKDIIKRKGGIPRLYPATENGKVDGEPVLLTQKELNDKRQKQGPYTFGCQMLQDPTADTVQGFVPDWIKFYGKSKQDMKSTNMNIYILVDPANEKKKKSDYTSMWVLGAGADGNDYILDGIRDRLSLTERTRTLFELHRQWKQPNSKIPVGYEKYGKDADIEHIREKMEDENYRFDIVALGGSMAKNDRIRRTIPDFENGKIWFPKTLNYVTYEGVTIDLVQVFIDEEYIPFPVGEHDDMLDALSRKKDMSIVYPSANEPQKINIPSLKRL
jgi:predicted phage terminase large subunit-like protein